MNPDTVFITLLTCAYLGIGILGMRTVLREARMRPARARSIRHVVEIRHRPGACDL